MTNYSLAIVSGVVGLGLITATTLDFLTVGINYATLAMCTLWPTTIILTVIFKTQVKTTALPFVVSLISLVVALIIFFYAPSLELGFRWRLKGYTEVIKLVDQGIIQPDENGYAILPSEYQYLSDGHRIKIRTRDESTSILFFSNLGILGAYWGYVYRSDDTLPMNYIDDGCDRARRVKVDVSNWFLCISD